MITINWEQLKTWNKNKTWNTGTIEWVRFFKKNIIKIITLSTQYSCRNQTLPTVYLVLPKLTSFKTCPYYVFKNLPLFAVIVINCFFSVILLYHCIIYYFSCSFWFLARIYFKRNWCYGGQPKPWNGSIGHHTQTFRIIQSKRLSCEHQFIKPVCNLALVKILNENKLNLT